MEIANKYNIGDSVCRIKNRSNASKECPICKGTRKINIQGNIYDCPECNRQVWDIENFHEYTKIIGIIADIVEEDISIKYLLDYDDWDFENEYFGEDNLFLTKEEALAECNNRNKKEENKLIYNPNNNPIILYKVGE